MNDSNTASKSDRRMPPESKQVDAQPSTGDERSSWLPAVGGWRSVSILAAILLLGGVVVGGAFVVTGGELPFLAGDTETSSIDRVPAGVHVVLTVDAGIIDDPATETIVGNTIDGDNQALVDAGPASTAEILSLLNNESAVGLSGFESATVFAKYPGDTPQSIRYAGAIIQSNRSETELVSRIEDNGVTLNERTHNGRTVYVGSAIGLKNGSLDIGSRAMTVNEGDVPSDIWLAPLDNGTFVLGSEQAVRESIDVEHGDMNSFQGDQRKMYDNLRDGRLKFVSTIPETATVFATDLPMGEKITSEAEYIAGTYYTNNTKVGVELHMKSVDQSGAESVTNAIEGAKSGVKVLSSERNVTDFIDSIEISQNGREVDVAMEYPAMKLISAVEQISDIIDILA